MKTTPYTLALIGAGLVSWPAVMHAEEKGMFVQTALASTTLSGYVDTSAQWNIGTGNENLPPYKFGGASKADGFNLNVVQLRLDKPLDEGSWSAGYRADLWLGPDANTLGTASTLHTTGTSSDFALRQAYVALRAPIGNGIDLKLGVFDSVIGYESVESPSNPNFTRSYGHSLEPQTHTGLLASYRVSDCVSFSVGIANTKGPQINDRAFQAGEGEAGKAESHKTYMGSIALTAPDSWGFLSGSSFYAGIVSGFDDNEVGTDYDENSASYYVGATIATPVTGLRLGVAFDYLDVRHFAGVRDSLGFAGDVNPGTAWSLGLYASYQATEKLSLHVRGEYLEDRADYFASTAFNGAYFNPRGFKVWELTGTIQYDLWKNVLTRLEARWDHGNNGRYFGASTDSEAPDFKRNEVVLIANVVYKF